jgi:hypothetical protein
LIIVALLQSGASARPGIIWRSAVFTAAAAYVLTVCYLLIEQIRASGQVGGESIVLHFMLLVVVFGWRQSAGADRA